MSTPPNDPSRRGRRPDSSSRRRDGSRRPDDAPPGVCRGCKAAPALPGEETCHACGEQALARAREGVETWLHMHAERVRELEREERRNEERSQ